MRRTRLLVVVGALLSITLLGSVWMLTGGDYEGALDDEGDTDIALAPGEAEAITLTHPTSEDDGGGGDSQAIDSCTVISEPGAYELIDDIERNGESAGEEHDDACIRIAASDVVLEGNDNALVGAGEEGTIGVLVADTGRTAVENVTIRELRAEHWETGVSVYESSNQKMADVTASENENHGIYVEYSADTSIEAVNASGNGGSGIYYIGDGRAVSVRDTITNHNGGNGISLVEAEASSMVDITANENEEHGVDVSLTSGVIAERIIVSENGRNGVGLSTDVYRSEFSGIYASDNAGAGITIAGDSDGNVVRDSTVEGNDGPGIRHSYSERNEFRNVTVRYNDDRQVEADLNESFPTISAAELRIGDAAEFAFDEELVSLDVVERDDLPRLPECAQAVGDGVVVEGTIENGLDATLKTDDEAAGRIELWRYDGREWTPEVTGVDEADGDIEATLTEDGIYAPVLVE